MSRPADHLRSRGDVRNGLSARPSRRSLLRAWLREWLPPPVAVDLRERLRVALGVLLGVMLTALLSRAVAGPPGAAWLVAPIGASAVLVFGLPSSPMAQPWPVAAGNALSALVGVGCVLALGTGPAVAALAVGLAVTAMFALRCLHPPGGACALLTVMAGVHDPAFALFPVFTNSLLLVATAVLYHHVTGRRYPQVPGAAPAAPHAARPGMPRFNEADLDAVLARHNQLLDVSREDLMSLLEQAELQAYRRQLVAVHCRDIMSRNLATAQESTPLQDAWTLLRQRGIKALPVVDATRRVVGVVTLADFMKGAELDLHRGWVDRLRGLLKTAAGDAAAKAETVGQIMTRNVQAVGAEQPIAELVPLFAASGHHHIPVVDDDRRLVGIITQSDLVRSLSQAGA